MPIGPMLEKQGRPCSQKVHDNHLHPARNREVRAEQRLQNARQNAINRTTPAAVSRVQRAVEALADAKRNTATAFGMANNRKALALRAASLINVMQAADALEMYNGKGKGKGKGDGIQHVNAETRSGHKRPAVNSGSESSNSCGDSEDDGEDELPLGAEG